MDDYLWKIPQHPLTALKIDELLTSGKSFSPIGGYYGLIVDYGGDHAFGDSFRTKF